MAADETGELLGWDRFFSELRSLVVFCNRRRGRADRQLAVYVVERLQIAAQNVSTFASLLRRNEEEGPVQELQEYTRHVDDLMEAIRQLILHWELHMETLDARMERMAYHAPRIHHARRRGRPKFHITSDQLQYLRSLSFSWTAISSLLCVSRMTVYRRRKAYGLLGEPRTVPNDAELSGVVRRICSGMPEIGQILVHGRIRAMGYHVTRERLREVMRAQDPLNTALRMPGGLTARRKYSVAGPNSLWHVDGHHKLIRWKLVTHAGIDGFSRMVVYMRCSANNRSSTVYDLFIQAVGRFFLPSRVRSDQGQENRLIALHMVRYRGIERRSMIVGSSVHNQRIERLWRDLFRSTLRLYYRLFYYLEARGLLDPLNELHLYSLHYIYLPRINHSLAHFQQGWNHHGIRTANSKSPYQLFTAGALQLQQSGMRGLDFFSAVDEQYGVEEVGLPPEEDDEVTFSENRFTLEQTDLLELQHLVNPVQESQNYGIELFVRTREFVYQCVRQNPGVYSL